MKLKIFSFFIIIFPASIYAQFQPIIELSSLQAKSGYTIDATASNSRFGLSVSNIGDFSGDGIDDYAISDSHFTDNQNHQGKVYVVYGSNGFNQNQFDISLLDGSNGFGIIGQEFDVVGTYISNAGDFNHDGYDDLIIGTMYYDEISLYSGRHYILFGGIDSPSDTLDLSTLNSSDGIIIHDIRPYEFSGHTATLIGDMNGDNIDDIAIGIPEADATNMGHDYGSVFVLFGEQNPPTTIQLSQLNGNNGFRINGLESRSDFGRSVASAGDFNNDGYNDLIIGSKDWFPDDNFYTADSYLVFGKNGNFPASLNVINFNGTNGMTIVGEIFYQSIASNVGTAGDFNNDGYSDILISAPGLSESGYPSDSGVTYVVFGTTDTLGSIIELSSINGSNGFKIRGDSELAHLGISLDSGDINGDFIDDIFIAANGTLNSGLNKGAVHVIFGKKQPFDGVFDISIIDGKNGFTLIGDVNDQAGVESISNAGDINGDGLSDLIIGAPGLSNTPGKTYVIYANDVIFKNNFNDQQMTR